MIALCVPSQNFMEVPAMLHMVNTFEKALFTVDTSSLERVTILTENN